MNERKTPRNFMPLHGGKEQYVVDNFEFPPSGGFFSSLVLKKLYKVSRFFQNFIKFFLY